MALQFNPVSGQFDLVGVNSISKTGSAQLQGNVTLTGGTNVTLTQTGQDITIAATGGGGGGDVTGPASSTDNAVTRFDGTTGKLIQNSGAILSDDANLYVNNYLGNGTATTSAGGTTVLTVASSRFQVLTGSSSQTYQLPDATTLTRGPWFVFNNNSSGSLIITNNGGSTLYTVPAGGIIECGPTSISTANGSWDFHGFYPGTVTWSSGTSGLIFNTALTTTPQIQTGTSSAANPSFIPQRGSSTTGYGGDSTHLYGSIGGAATFTSTASTFSIASGSQYQINGTQIAASNLSNGTTGSGAVALATGPTFATSITGSYLTASRILITDGSKNIISANTTTYPSLTELSYVKGVTSSIQTQLNAKGTGSVTSVNVSGGTTGLTFSGGPVTTSGTITMSGTLDVDNGGTGQTSYTNGQLLIGNTTGNTLTKATLTAGSGVAITNGSGSITIASTGGGTTWTEVTGTSQSAAVDNGYITNNAGLVTVTLPSTAAVGQVVRIAGKGAGGWRVAQNSGQAIHFGVFNTTTGVTGRLDSVNRYDAVELICTTANTDWNVLSSQGNITVT